MRLPPFLTEISPIGETLAAELQGEKLLAGEIGHRSDQLTAATADDGLRLWEEDYGLPHTGSLADRRTAIRTALSSDRTLTPARLRELAVTIGGADEGQVVEDFPHWRVTLESMTHGRTPVGTAELQAVVARLKPAHLEVDVKSLCQFRAAVTRYMGLTGSLYLELSGR